MIIMEYTKTFEPEQINANLPEIQADKNSTNWQSRHSHSSQNLAKKKSFLHLMNSAKAKKHRIYSFTVSKNIERRWS